MIQIRTIDDDDIDEIMLGQIVARVINIIFQFYRNAWSPNTKEMNMYKYTSLTSFRKKKTRLYRRENFDLAKVVQLNNGQTHIHIMKDYQPWLFRCNLHRNGEILL